MHRRPTPRTVMHRTYEKLSDFLTDAAPVLVTLLWAVSVVSILLDAFAPDPAIEWGHLASWFALAAIGVNSHALVRHCIARLTQIIALWQEDVHILHGPSQADVRPAVGQENVVPILRTTVTRRRRPAGN